MHALTSIFLFSTCAYAHGIIRSPHARGTGAASTAACGTAVTTLINRDNTSYVEALPAAAIKDSGYHADKCNLYLCKGLQFDDNKANVQRFTPGQVVPVSIYLRIPHKGIANVSVVDTSSNTVIGEPLLRWSNYADETLPKIPADNSEFSVTIPSLNGKCTVEGECVLQWWWFGTGAKQTYESCVDFTVPKSNPMKARLWKS